MLYLLQLQLVQLTHFFYHVTFSLTQAITALAHLRACVVCVLDISEQCGYSLQQQCDLFNNIKPLFANKPLIVALNKIDARRPEDLSQPEKVRQEAFFGIVGSHSDHMTVSGIFGYIYY